MLTFIAWLRECLSYFFTVKLLFFFFFNLTSVTSSLAGSHSVPPTHNECGGGLRVFKGGWSASNTKNSPAWDTSSAAHLLTLFSHSLIIRWAHSHLYYMLGHNRTLFILFILFWSWLPPASDILQREKQSVCVCVRDRQREKESVCVCVCVCVYSTFLIFWNYKMLRHILCVCYPSPIINHLS